VALLTPRVRTLLSQKVARPIWQAEGATSRRGAAVSDTETDQGGQVAAPDRGVEEHAAQRDAKRLDWSMLEKVPDQRWFRMVVVSTTIARVVLTVIRFFHEL
jgi:hypothetical protein